MSCPPKLTQPQFYAYGKLANGHTVPEPMRMAPVVINCNVVNRSWCMCWLSISNQSFQSVYRGHTQVHLSGGAVNGAKSKRDYRVYAQMHTVARNRFQ